MFSFIDTPGSVLTQPDKQDYLVVYPKNEQLKFYMVANYLMYKNGEFAEYEALQQRDGGPSGAGAGRRGEAVRRMGL